MQINIDKRTGFLFGIIGVLLIAVAALAIPHFATDIKNVQTEQITQMEKMLKRFGA